MAHALRIEKSNKRGFHDQESYIVTRGRISYLRIVGNQPTYSLMTATASEDDRSYYVCEDMVRLISSALQLGTKLGTPYSRERDSFGRSFVHICGMTFSPDREQEDLEELRALLEAFFQIFDAYDPASHQVMSDMRNLFTELSDGSSNEDVYLSDGVWLSFDGRIHGKDR